MDIEFIYFDLEYLKIFFKLCLKKGFYFFELYMEVFSDVVM